MEEAKQRKLTYRDLVNSVMTGLTVKEKETIENYVNVMNFVSVELYINQIVGLLCGDSIQLTQGLSNTDKTLMVLDDLRNGMNYYNKKIAEKLN